MTWEWKNREEAIDVLAKRGDEIVGRAYALHHNERADTFRPMLIAVGGLLRRASHELRNQDEAISYEMSRLKSDNDYVRGALERTRASFREQCQLTEEIGNDLARWKAQNAVLWTEILKLRADVQKQMAAMPSGARAYHED